MSGGPMAGRIQSTSAWCLSSVVVVADQQQQPRSTTVLVQDGTGKEIRCADCTRRLVQCTV